MDNKLTFEQQAQFVQDVIETWVVSADDALKAAIGKRSKHIPSRTLNRLRFQVLQASANSMAKITLAFQDEARIVDMRRIIWNAAPITEDEHFILEWAKKRGAGRFRRGVPGYKDKNPKLPADKKLLRIANAIVQAKAQNRKYRRRGQWYNKTLYRQVNVLIGRLMSEQAQWVADNLAEDIKMALAD